LGGTWTVHQSDAKPKLLRHFDSGSILSGSAGYVPSSGLAGGSLGSGSLGTDSFGNGSAGAGLVGIASLGTPFSGIGITSTIVGGSGCGGGETLTAVKKKPAPKRAIPPQHGNAKSKTTISTTTPTLLPPDEPSPFDIAASLRNKVNLSYHRHSPATEQS
jgi:hypothetical protein